MKQILFFVAMIILLSGTVLAYTITRNAPDEYSIETGLAVTFNITCTAPINDTSTAMNSSIYWKTNRSAVYNETKFGVTNGTSNITSITFNDNSRVWWKASCYDLFGEFGVINESKTLVNATVNSTFIIPAVNSTLDLTGGIYLIQGVVGFVNSSGSDYRELVENIDYSRSNSIITNLNSSLVGNTSVWSFNRHIDLINDTYKIQSVSGWVNYSGGNYREMVLESDYTISDGLISFTSFVSITTGLTGSSFFGSSLLGYKYILSGAIAINTTLTK